MRQGIAHLIAHGHRRIGYLGDAPAVATAMMRNRGYQEELAAHVIDFDPALVRLQVHGIEHAEEAALELLSMPLPPTALLTSQNLFTIGAYRALRRLGLHHRVAMVGFDDFPYPWSDAFRPRLTTVAQPTYELGRRAAEMLVERLSHRGRATHTFSERVILEGNLVVRESSGPLVTPDSAAVLEPVADAHR